MYETQIPMLAYVFIGITTLVLSYVTVMDTGDDKPTSTTSVLPSFTKSDKPQENTFERPQEKPFERPQERPLEKPQERSQEQSIGGNKNKHKKTKRNRLT